MMTPKKKKIIIILSIAFLILLILSGVRLFFGGEDVWICGDNGWEKHGNPSETRPLVGCGDLTNEE